MYRHVNVGPSKKVVLGGCRGAEVGSVGIGNIVDLPSRNGGFRQEFVFFVADYRNFRAKK